MSKAILENIDIHAHHRFGIQTVSADGQVSELSEILYEGVEEVTSEENSDTESEMDMHTVIDENEYKHGAKRLVSYLTLSRWLRSTVDNVSDCRSRGHEFDPSPVPYFCGDRS